MRKKLPPSLAAPPEPSSQSSTPATFEAGLGLVMAVGTMFVEAAPTLLKVGVIGVGLTLMLHGLKRMSLAQRFARWLLPIAIFGWGFLAAYTAISTWPSVFLDLSSITKPPTAVQLLRIKDRQFKNESVRVDGHEFVNCTFENVTLIYEGGSFRLINVRYINPVEIRLATTNTSVKGALELFRPFFGDKLRIETP